MMKADKVSPRPRCAWHHNLRVQLCLCLLVVLFSGSVYLAHLATTTYGYATPARRHQGVPRRYLIQGTGCTIPWIAPFHESIVRYIRHLGKIHCGDQSMTYVDGSTLRVRPRRDLENCRYWSIVRPSGVGDDRFDFENGHTQFKSRVLIKDEFIKVVCYSKNGTIIHTDYHTFIPTKEHVEERCRTFNKAHPVKRKVNYLLLGIDSVSRVNFHRQMPNTTSLLGKLDAVDMIGYTKVADNTHVNISPLCAGKFIHELPWFDNSSAYFDEFQFLWSRARKRGYVTLFAEDAPEIAIFNFMKKGFDKPPADYYLRPFSLAIEQARELWSQNNSCFGDRLETDLVLDYTLEFMNKFHKKNLPFFAFSFLTRLTHEDINDASRADESYFKFLNKLSRSGLLDNTVVLLYSDHGMRFGAIRRTVSGAYEERMPACFWLIPEWFKQEYADQWNSLKVNRQRLTSPFDVYQTLRHIEAITSESSQNSQAAELSYSPSKFSKHGTSLLMEINQSRTCRNASIPEHYCACVYRGHKGDATLGIQGARTVGRIVVNRINRMLSPFANLCHKLLLAKVHSAVRVTKERFRVTVTSKPGGAIFEATVSIKRGRSTILGDISRVNKFNNQSHCVYNHIAKKYCFCK